MREKPKAIGEANGKMITQLTTKDDHVQRSKEKKTLFSWFEEAMKEKPRPIKEVFSTARGPRETNHNFINEEPANQNFINGTFINDRTTILTNPDGTVEQ